MSDPCLRCGSFESAAPRPVAGIALCRDCLDPGMARDARPSPPYVATVVGFAHGLARMVVILVPLLVTWAIGLVAMGDTFMSPGGAFVILAAATFFSVLVVLPFGSAVGARLASFVLAPLDRRAALAWKRRLAEPLALTAATAESLAFAELVPIACGLPRQVGLVAAGEGLAFLGARGARVVLTRETVRTASAPRSLFFPLRVLSVTLANGEQLGLAVREADPRAVLASWAAKL